MNRLLPLCLLLCPAVVLAQSDPGDVFREYTWSRPRGQAGGMLRVGGKLDYGGGPIALPHELDLQHATRAEVVLERLLCHDGTRGLAIAFNDHDWIAVPESSGIPEPQWDYQHHTYPVVRIPLEHLKPSANQSKLRVSPEHPWKWPQQLIYGMHLRIYYDPVTKPHPIGRIVAPKAGVACGRSVELGVEAASPNGPIRRVDFLGDHADVNLEGDSVYAQWHYHYSCGELRGHLGSAGKAPWRITWDTSWVSDQPKPFRIAARITNASGLIMLLIRYETKEVR